MLASSDRIYFTDPFADKVPAAVQVLVTDTLNIHRRGELRDRIVTIRKHRHHNGARLWYVTTAGDYVDGVPLNPQMKPGDPMMGLLGNVFVTGTSMYVGKLTDVAEVTDPIRSDQVVVHAADGEGYTQPRQPVAQWVAAAPWAKELMPSPFDADSVVQAKLALAKTRWEHARARAGLVVEAVDRDWAERLERLVEQGHPMPVPRYGAVVTGQLQLPVDTPAHTVESPEFKAMKERIAESSAVTPWTGQAYVSVAVEVPADLSLEEPDFNEVSPDSYERTARRLFDITNARIGGVSPTAFVRTLTY
jgi:hypothetical protein